MDSAWIFWPALIIAAVSSCGTSHKQIRTGCNELKVRATATTACESPALKLEDLRRLNEREATRTLKSAAIERLTWDAPAGTTHRFTIGIVEFDDQGNAWDNEQIQAVRRALEDTLKRTHTLVAVFVHGWKNDCKACNGNLACFRESLALLSANEKRLAALLTANDPEKKVVPPREVFGLYVAWRGASSKIEPSKELSFFGRKAAADRIGSARGGELTRLLGWLNGARDTVPTTSVSPLRNMISLVGHSFGADVLFGAVANALDASIGAASVESGGLSAKPFGDVLVLVNPAFEASAYRRFDDYADETWKPGHPPLMITVQARNDWATHYAFPAGRSIATLPQSSGTGDGYKASLTALGHRSGFYTHDLAPSPPATSVAMLEEITGMKPTARTAPEQLEQLVEMMTEKPAQDPPERCGCNGTRATDQTLEVLSKSILEALKATPPPGGLRVGSPMVGLTTQMQPCGSPNLDAPLLLVRTDPPIVDGHSGITNLEFFDFLANFIVRTQLLRDPQLHVMLRGTALAPAPTPPTWPACR